MPINKQNSIKINSSPKLWFSVIKIFNVRIKHISFVSGQPLFNWHNIFDQLFIRGKPKLGMKYLFKHSTTAIIEDLF